MSKNKILQPPLSKNIEEPNSKLASASMLLELKLNKIPFLILFISSCLLYANTISHEYALDDQLAIYENKFVTKGIAGIGDLMTNDAFVGFFGDRGSKLISGGRYRPLSFVTFALEWEVFSNNPHVSHAINVLLYGFLCCAIYYFLLLLFKKEGQNGKFDFISSLPFLGAMLYCFHPIHTEVVANIKGRDELLCFLFGMLSFIYYLKFFDEKKWSSYLILFTLFFFALMSKENAITFIAVFPLISFIRGRSFLKMFDKSFLSVIVATILFLVLRSKFTAVSVADQTTEILNNPFVLASTSEKYATILYSFLKYFILLIFPHPLTHDYYFNQIPYKKFSDPVVLMAIAGLIIILYLTLKNWKEKSPIFFGIVFYFITFSIVSNVLFTVGIIMNERFVFISSLGFCICLAYFMLKFKLNQTVAGQIGLISFVLILYSFKTIDRNFAWKNNNTLFATDFVTSNQSAKVSTSFGGMLYEDAIKLKDTAAKRRMLDSSIIVLKHGIDIYPENSQTWLLYANAIYARTGNYHDAIDIYQRCNALRGNSYFDASYNMAVLYYNAGTYDSALMHAEIATKINPEHKEAKSVLSRALAKLGRTKEALAIGGMDNSSLSSLALDAKDGGNYPEALSLAEQALALNNQDATANYVKGICLARYMNRIPEGIPYLQKAIQLNDKNQNWMEDLAVAYGITGQVQETIPLLEKAIAIRPSRQLYSNLATSYFKIGNKAKADYYINLANSSPN